MCLDTMLLHFVCPEDCVLKGAACSGVLASQNGQQPITRGTSLLPLQKCLEHCHESHHLTALAVLLRYVQCIMLLSHNTSLSRRFAGSLCNWAFLLQRLVTNVKSLAIGQVL